MVEIKNYPVIFLLPIVLLANRLMYIKPVYKHKIEGQKFILSPFDNIFHISIQYQNELIKIVVMKRYINILTITYMEEFIIFV